MFSKIYEEDDLNKEIIDNLTKAKNNLEKQNIDLKNSLLNKNDAYKKIIEKNKKNNLRWFKAINHIKSTCENFFIFNNI